MVISSAGGVGDVLLVSALKINKNQYRHVHYEKHECHKRPCEDIMHWFTHDYEFVVSKNPDEEAKKAGQYISTNITGIISPYLKEPIENEFYINHDSIINNDGQYIVIQMVAGRMNDNTKRGFTPEFVKDVQNHTDRTIVLVGPEKIEYTGKNIINFTGKTESILDVFSIINGCKVFIGMDGVCAYYSMMLSKQTIIFYHIPTLVSHYWNQGWDAHSMAFHSGNWIHRLPNNSTLKGALC